MAKIIDGKYLAEKIKLEIRKEIVESGIEPGLAVILLGENQASHLYVKLKEKACHQVGIDFYKYYCDNKTCQSDILQAIKFLNNDPKIDAILVQLPLPQQFDEEKIIKALNPAKDVDGFHPRTIKNFLKGQSVITPGLPAGIMALIESTDEKLTGKQALIISNSPVFAKPLIKLFQDKKIQAQACLSDDPEIKNKGQQADILVVAVGRPGYIKADIIKKDAIIIDVGINKLDHKVVGDVDFEDVEDKAGWISPVPGGVGPMTIAMLLKNALKLAQKHQKK